MVHRMYIPAAVVIFIAIIAAKYCYYKSPAACDMEDAENRDFSKYYGLEGKRNPFTIAVADTCDSDIVIRSVLPQAILKPDLSASSFMVMEKFGAGKTMVRCQYVKSLPLSKHFLVLIFNKELNEYLERFVNSASPAGTDRANTNPLLSWSKDEFAHVLLSMLVTRFVDQFEQHGLELWSMAIEEKIELITVMCFYYNGFGVTNLEKMVNFFLNKKDDAMHSAKKAVTQIEEQGKRQDKMLLKHFRDDLKKLAVLRHDPEKLHLLLAVVENEEFAEEALSNTVHSKVFRDLIHFTDFVKSRLHKTVVFIVDGIDENQYFFHKREVNTASLTLFYLSSVSQEIQASLMTQNFYLSIFYPKIKNIDIQSEIIRPDKFPTYSITWNSESLINYADQLLTKMNKGASYSQCKSLTSFRAIINYKERKIATIIDQIATPRELHYFMIELIRILNNNAATSKTPFVATPDNVKQACCAAREHFDKFREEKLACS